MEDQDNQLVRIQEKEAKEEEKKLTETQTEFPIDLHEENVRQLAARQKDEREQFMSWCQKTNRKLQTIKEAKSLLDFEKLKHTSLPRIQV